MQVAIIGAGIAGIAAGRCLAAEGVTATLFDKGRAPGGRLSTRRVLTAVGEAAFDHGAQYVTAREPGFSACLDALKQAGQAALWTGDFAGLKTGEKWVGVPGMSALPRALGVGLDIRSSVRVSSVIRSGEYWSLAFEDGQTADGFDALILALPPDQARPFLAVNAPALAGMLDGVEVAPCWSCLLAFDEPLASVPDAREGTDGPLAWIARNSSKPQRTGPEAFVVQAAADWSRAHLDLPPEAAAALLMQAFRGAFDAPSPIHVSAHRWRYARTVRPLGTACLSDRRQRLFLCGDWMLGARVEAGFLSGSAAARELLQA